MKNKESLNKNQEIYNPNGLSAAKLWPKKTNEIRQYTGLLIRCSIYWNSRKNYDDYDEKDYAKIEIWWDNTKDRNDPANRVEATAYPNMVDYNVWRQIRNEYNNNRDQNTFYEIVVDEKNRLLGFKKDNNLKTLIKMKRASGINGKEVFEL